MPLMTRLRGLLQRRRAHREIDDELAFHLEMETRANAARGMDPAKARREARRALGGVAQTKEAIRDVRTLGVEWVWQDLRHSVRALAAHPRFTFAAAGMLSLAIGLTTAMFTLVDALVVRPVPFEDPDQLARVWMGNERGGRTIVSATLMRAWQESPAFAAVEAATTDTALLEAGGTVVTRQLARVTPGVFDMLGGVRPVLGRLFDVAEGHPGRSDRLLVSETVWRALYDADPGLVGRSMGVNGEQLTVVGILPADFRFPTADTMLWRPDDLSTPGQLVAAYGRFARGVPRDDALRLATEAARAVDTSNAKLRARLLPLAGMEDVYSARAVSLLVGGVVLAFLVLCANVCSLLLARLSARRREFGMRAALGASRWRMMRQALLESGVLGALGVGMGAGIAWALVSIARTLLPEPLLLQTLNPLDLDQRALAATSVSGLVAALAAGLAPAWLGTRVDAGDSLRVADRGGTETRSARVLTRGLLIVEVSLACTLLVGATLLTRSFVNLARADRGLETTGVSTLWLALPSAAADAAARELLVRTIEDELRTLPGVGQVAWSYGLPPGGAIISEGDWIGDLPGAAPVNATFFHYIVSPDFFALYRIPIVRGRLFAASDPYTSVVVSERLAQTLWPGVDPIGRTFRFEKQQFQVVGLAREIHYPTVNARRDGPEFYHPYNQPVPTPMVSLRCEPGCPDGAVIRHRLASTHPAVRVQDAGPVERDYAEQLARPRAAAALALAFASVALLATAGGLFSVLSYAVGRRRREFGVRAAIGASARQIRRAVQRDALLVGASGVALGSLFAAALARALASVQYGVTPADPLSWSLVLGLMALTTMAASWGPARAAATLDPVLLLREE